MPRSHRIQFSGLIHHVFARGNEKMNIFTNDKERLYFTTLLKKIKIKYDFELYAYALMPNHYHLLIKPKIFLLSKIMQSLNSRYAQFFNWRHNRVGHLYQDRYKNIIVEDSGYLLDAVRYIHRNPIKRKKQKQPSDYRWTSHPEYMDAANSKYVDKEFVLGFFDDNHKKAVNDFGSFVDGSVYKTDFERFTGYIDRLVSGSKEFTTKIMLDAVSKKLRVPSWAFRGNWADPEDILLKTSKLFNINRSELLVKKGKWNKAKKAAIYMLWKNTSLSVPEIAGIFNKQHPSGIKRIIESVRFEMADNDNYKSLIFSLENSLLKSGV